MWIDSVVTFFATMATPGGLESSVRRYVVKLRGEKRSQLEASIRKGENPA